MGNLNKNYILWSVLIISLALFCCRRFFSDDVKKQLINKQTTIVNVEKVVLSKTNMVLDFVGTAVSNEAVNITSNITQKVAKVNFSDCDFVKKGTLLVQLNVEKLKTQQKQAEINLREQQREFSRLSALKAKNVVASKDYDAQHTKLQDAQAKLDEVIEEIKEGSITAPFDGILGFRQISEGALLTSNSVITTIDDIKQIKVDFAVPEKYFSMIQNGNKIKVTCIVVPNKIFDGKVIAMDPRISEGARSISVRGLIENDGYFLRPGMTLNISMEILNRDAIMISEKAVFNVGEKHFVFALIENNKVKQMPVEIGQRQRGTVEILSGLAEGDCVVTEGVTKISDGDKVEVR